MESVPYLIQNLDLERRVAILQKIAEQQKVTLPKDVARYIAQNITSSTRELAGAVIRLVAHSSLTGAEITLAYTQQVLKHFDPPERNVTVDPFQTMTAGQRGTNESKNRPDPAATDRSIVLDMLQGRVGRKGSRVRHELEVNILEVKMRECERDLLARLDGYERWLERCAKKRKQA
jgi:Bacterial dnaA  protein